MQAIERYGVVALLLLIGTVVAVLVWDGAPVDPSHTVSAAEPSQVPMEVAQGPTDDELAQRPAQAPGRLSLSGRSENRGLTRGGLQQLSRDPSEGMFAEDLGRPEEAVYDSRRQGYDDPRAMDAAYTPEAGYEGRGERFETYRSESLPRQESQPAFVENYEPDPVVQPAPLRREEPRTVTYPQSSSRKYKIKSGDTLGQISLDQLGTSKRWREILEVNPGLNEKKLFVGKEILLPEPGVESGASAPEPERSPTRKPEAAPKASGQIYVVQRGDNLWKIAAKTLGDRERWREILAVNPKIDPDKILVGQKLALPAEARQVSEPIVASGANTGTQGRRSVR